MIPLLIGLGVLIGGVLVVAYWDEIIDWLDDFIPKLKQAWKQVRPFVPAAAAIYGDLIIEGADTMVKIMHKLYYKENGEWMEQTTTRKVNADNVPAHIRNKISYQEADITSTIQPELSVEV